MLFLKLWLILKSNVLLILKIRLYLIILDINILEYYLIKVRKILSNFNYHASFFRITLCKYEHTPLGAKYSRAASFEDAPPPLFLDPVSWSD
jgi:hypothetical protein